MYINNILWYIYKLVKQLKESIQKRLINPILECRHLYYEMFSTTHKKEYMYVSRSLNY